MKIRCLGGVETVTGSKYLVSTDSTQLLIDCGLFQGYKVLRERNRQPLDLNIKDIDAVLISHAHLDHSGYIPVLYNQGYRGPVYTHPATKTLCSILLADSGHLQEEDARYFRHHKIGAHSNPEPLYTRADAIKSLSLFKDAEFKSPITIGDIVVTFLPAGHILGAASVLLSHKGKTVCFSGDVGHSSDMFMCPPEPLPNTDLLFLESTYGNRLHSNEPIDDQIESIVNNTTKSGGTILIPSFAVGRAQAILHVISLLKKEGRIHNIPVFLDSPMAINVADIYCRFQQYHKLTPEQCHDMCSVAEHTKSTDDSKSLANIQYPHIIIAGSGMATGGRILHHFKRLLKDHRTTVLFTGYQANGTRGQKLLSNAPFIKIHGKWIENKANISMLNGMSGHADYRQLSEWLSRSNLAHDTRVRLVHGEGEALEFFKDHLQRTTTYDVQIAKERHVYEL